MYVQTAPRSVTSDLSVIKARKCRWTIEDSWRSFHFTVQALVALSLQRRFLLGPDWTGCYSIGNDKMGSSM
jgi:hypothetical protein